MKTFEIILEDEETKKRICVEEKGWDVEDMLAVLSEKYGFGYIIVRVIPVECEDEENPLIDYSDELLANDKPWNIVECRNVETSIDYGDMEDIEEEYAD
jgi:hypothetical protein